MARRRWHLHHSSHAFAGQLDGHDGSTGGRTRNAYGALVSLDEAPDSWQPQTRSGHPLSPGVYFLRMRVDGRTMGLRKVTLLD